MRVRESQTPSPDVAAVPFSHLDGSFRLRRNSFSQEIETSMLNHERPM
ncbi:hypothetical protein KOR42_13850 [Thalassoglobus neptunius]|uniref:Uncharacterized protein n=1 Tax=Thalassoglobus neptunius TaxID=1938619 RepID=A0A5C5X4T4_9PLAN|nr:hypothetical protein KOR42_13850 [Thalassoglobus neptunius]